MFITNWIIRWAWKYKEVINSSDSTEWLKAMEEEINSINKN